MVKTRKAGIWAGNGAPRQKDLMLSWMPDTVTVIYEYIGSNGILEYKQRNPNVQVIVRFMHPHNWLDEVEVSATNQANEIIGKWRNDPVLRALSPMIYISNEMNLHIECGDNDPKNQWKYETKEHYAKIGTWFTLAAKLIKEAIPEMKLLSPPLAYGHQEDGEPDIVTGIPKLGWAGYDYLEPAINLYCDKNLAAHFYWGNGQGSRADWLDPAQDGTWHAFRWQRVLKLWETRYGYKPTIWIDETGNFAPQDSDFTEQCEYYVKNTLKNPNIGGLTFFLWDDTIYPPANAINSWVDKVLDLPAHVDRMSKLIVEIDEGDDTMGLWFEEFTKKARDYYAQYGEALNDAVDYGVRVESPPVVDGAELKFVVVGVHHLTGDENRGNRHIYFDVLDLDHNRMNSYLVQTTELSGEKLTAMVEKPANEPGGNIPMFKDKLYNDTQVLSVNDEYPSGRVNGLSTVHDDEEEGNTLYHHSFFVVWDLMKVNVPVPPEPPEPPLPPVQPETPAETASGCDGAIALSNAATLLACGKLSEAAYVEIVQSITGNKANG